MFCQAPFFKRKGAEMGYNWLRETFCGDWKETVSVLGVTVTQFANFP